MIPANRIESTLSYVSDELPSELRHDSFARNLFKHRSNLTDACAVLPDEPSDILDIGSGIGVFPSAMAHLGHRVSSLDMSANNHPWLKEHLVSVGTCDILGEPIPFPDASFELVTLFDVIEHLHGSPRHMLSEVYRVLRPGGRIIVETPNIVNLKRRLAFLFGRNIMSVRYFYESPYPYSGHVYEYTKSDLESALRWSGFEVTDSRHMAVMGRYHRTAEGFAEGIRIRGAADVAMLGYLAACGVVPSFRDTLLCVGQRP